MGWPGNHEHGCTVYQLVLQGHIWIILGHLFRYLAPQFRGCQNILLVNASHQLAAVAGNLKGPADNPFDFLCSIIIDIPRLVFF